jgi:hypothetical protein
MNSKYFEYIEVAIESMDISYMYEHLVCSSPIRVPSELNNMPCYISPKLCKHSHPQKTQHLDFLTGHLRLMHLLVHHVVHLGLQGQDVVLLTLRTSTPIAALTASSLG